MIDIKDIIGKRFGKLIVISFHSKKNNYNYYLCKCDCGKEVIVIRGSLLQGFTKSCGCYAVEKKTKHELINHPLYKKWSGMKYRCYNKKCKYYYCYGGKGIQVCDEWLNNFENFYNWAINNGYKKDLTIDRIDNNKGYSPNNCRWVTPKQQANNRTNNHFITYNGITKTISEWADFTKLTHSAIRHRIERGWSIKKILTTPLKIH